MEPVQGGCDTHLLYLFERLISPSVSNDQLNEVEMLQTFT